MENKSEKKKLVIILGIVGAVTLVAAIVAGIIAVKVFRSDRFVYRRIIKTKAPIVYSVEDIRALQEEEECYLFVSDIDRRARCYLGYLVDEKKHDSDTRLYLEIPISADWISADQLVIKGRYYGKEKMNLGDGDGKEAFYRFQVEEFMELDNTFAPDDDTAVKVDMLGKKTALSVGDTMSVALIGSTHASSIEYEGDTYYVFNYLDIDYDYEDCDAICKVMTDKQFIVRSEEEFFHINTKLDAGFEIINELRQSAFASFALPLIDVKVAEITPDGYYVLEFTEQDRRDIELVNVDTENHVFTSENEIYDWEYVCNSFNEMIQNGDDENMKDLTAELIFFGSEEELIDYKETYKRKLETPLLESEPEPQPESVPEQPETESEPYSYFYVQFNDGNGQYDVQIYDSYETIISYGDWCSEAICYIPDFELEEGTIFRCKASDMDWQGQYLVISDLETLSW